MSHMFSFLQVFAYPQAEVNFTDVDNFDSNVTIFSGSLQNLLTFCRILPEPSRKICFDELQPWSIWHARPPAGERPGGRGALPLLHGRPFARLRGASGRLRGDVTSDGKHREKLNPWMLEIFKKLNDLAQTFFFAARRVERQI